MDIGLVSAVVEERGLRSSARSCFLVPGADLLKLTREDVIQICGPADGIRLFNALKGRWVSCQSDPIVQYVNAPVHP